MKDFYDLWMIAQTFAFEGDNLADAIRGTFERRRRGRVNGGAIMHHARRPDYPVLAAQTCAIYGPLLAVTGGGRCTAWSFMQRFGWRLSKRD